MGMKSSIGLPNVHCAGDNLVLGSGVLQYWRMACCWDPVSRMPLGSVLLVMRHLTVFTLISALQFECGKVLRGGVVHPILLGTGVA